VTTPARLVDICPARRVRGRLATAVAAVAFLATAITFAEQPRVKIEGGVDDTRQNYAWTIRNLSRSPIVYVEMPHYHADLFTAPQGWELDCTFLVNVGVPDRPGICAARASKPDAGIKFGSSGQFTMRISTLGAQMSPQTVKVKFADGTTVEVADVELPRPPIRGEGFVAGAGFALVLAVALLVHLWRRRRLAERAAGAAGADSTARPAAGAPYPPEEL